MNPLTKENYKTKIESKTSEDRKPLLDLIPVIEETETFTEPRAVLYTDENILSYKPPIEATILRILKSIRNQASPGV